MTNPARPLSKSASASQVSSPASLMRRFFGGGGGVASSVAPVLMYSLHALATAAFGSQMDDFMSPLNSPAGWALALSMEASHADLAFICRSGPAEPVVFGRRCDRQA